MTGQLESIVKRALVLAGAGAVVGVSAFFAFELARSLRGKASANAEASASPLLAQSAPPVAPSAARVDMRALIREAIEKAHVTSAAELDPFLSGLEARARRRGEVLAVDVEPGIAKCLDFGEPEKANAFGQRMKALEHELSGKKPEPQARPVVDRPRLDALFLGIRKSEGEERQKLIREYLRAIDTLPEEEQVERHVKLNEVAGRREERADPATLDALYQGIERASDEDERQALIREYLRLVDALPEEQALARTETLRRRFGKTSATAARADAPPP